MSNPTDTNQASEDEQTKAIYEAMQIPYLSERHDAINALIRTEKLKLLDRLSSHKEDLFWWTGGEYEKTTAVDMRAIAAERNKLKEMK